MHLSILWAWVSISSDVTNIWFRRPLLRDPTNGAVQVFLKINFGYNFPKRTKYWIFSRISKEKWVNSEKQKQNTMAWRCSCASAVRSLKIDLNTSVSHLLSVSLVLHQKSSHPASPPCRTRDNVWRHFWLSPCIGDIKMKDLKDLKVREANQCRKKSTRNSNQILDFSNLKFQHHQVWEANSYVNLWELYSKISVSELGQNRRVIFLLLPYLLKW